MKFSIIIFAIFCYVSVVAQHVSEKLKNAFTLFENDPQLANAISSLYVIDAKTGKVVFEKNAFVGMAPASTQKTITSITAFELLKKDFIYKTQLQIKGNVVNSVLQGYLQVIGSGDPTFGSHRYSSTKSEDILKAFTAAIQKKGIKQTTKPLSFNYNAYSYQAIADGWIMQDVGNYYGAAAHILNWKENQFDIILNSENNKEVIVLAPLNKKFNNELKAGPFGSGDNAYCYLPTKNNVWLLKGTIPTGEKRFTIAAADNEPPYTLLNDLFIALFKNKIEINGIEDFNTLTTSKTENVKTPTEIIYTHHSPTLDSIIYWFNKKSINLYGEALLKTMGNTIKANADSGVAVIKQFWAANGISKNELNIYDGSGLSPLNRVTTHAQVQVLQYAITKDWYKYFLTALPIYNGITMKSGSINGVKGFCGYHTATDGSSYVFSFLVNNFNGNGGQVATKMYKVLDVLK